MSTLKKSPIIRQGYKRYLGDVIEIDGLFSGCCLSKDR